MVSLHPTPKAPFLRVEYYNPALRWKVKRELERGLEGLPSIYYPDHVQYDCSPQDPNLPLSFHCYEAHIPYTMQFFKDYNLSGMAYIHLSDTSCGGKQHSLLRFRDPLPKRIPIHSNNHSVDENFLFLESNTSDSHRWNETSIVVDEANSVASQEDIHSLLMQQQQPSDSDPSPARRDFIIKKETSCGLELDVSVEAILNVLSVMTGIEEEDKDTVHWRAVPSLREIWQEERRRMAKLVLPSNDFLSQGLTLNVKKGAAKPGARLAVQGMRDLVDVTPGLKENFQRVLRDIVGRHDRAIQRVDDYLRKRPTLTPHPKAERVTTFTPSNDEVLEDLGALGELFGKSSPTSLSAATESQEEVSIELLSSQLSQNAVPLSQHDQRFREFSQSYYDLRQSQMDDCESTEYEMSQRVERGEGIVTDGPYEELDDFINPQTLLPYDDVGEDEDDDGFGGEDMSEDQLEKELHDLATQPLVHAQDYFFSLNGSSEPNHDLVESKESWDEFDVNANGAEMEVTRINHSPRNVTKVPSLMTLRRRPPTRDEVLSRGKATGLYAMSAENLTPEWVRHLYLYNKRKESKYRFDLSSQRDKKYNVQLVRQPPDREAVQQWLKTEQKKIEKTGRSASSRQPLLKEEVASGSQQDESCQKLVANVHSLDMSVEEAIVNEAEWIEDESPQPTLTPRTNNFDDTPESASATRREVLEGIGNQGGRLFVEGGGELKAKTRPSQMNASRATQTTSTQPYLPSPVTLMVLEVHVQCRTGRAGVNDSKVISMTPDSDRDKVSAVVYVFGRDPGGGEALETIERGCIFVPVGKEIEILSTKSEKPLESLAASVRRSMPRDVLGVSSPLSVEAVRDERQLLLRVASIIRLKDPGKHALVVKSSIESSSILISLHRKTCFCHGTRKVQVQGI